MTTLLSMLTISDWLVLGLIALVPFLMAAGLSAIRREMRAAARLQAQSIVLKTTADQRLTWRRNAPSRDLIALLDDVELLLKQLAVDDALARRDHAEAVQLAWRSRNVPVATLLVGSLILVGALSAILMVIAQGPANPIP